MPLIPAADARALARRFEATLAHPVTMHLFVESAPTSAVPGEEPCEACFDAKAIAGELAALSDRIRLQVYDLATNRARAAEMRVDRAPTLVIEGAGLGDVRFLGAPTGYEFGSLVAAIEAVSRGTTPLSPATRQGLASIAQPMAIRVFVTPTCPYCPRAAAVAHQMAVESEWVTAEVVQVNEFPDLGRRYHVHGVPKVVVNDEIEFVGAQPESAFIDALLRARSPEAVRERA